MRSLAANTISLKLGCLSHRLNTLSHFSATFGDINVAQMNVFGNVVFVNIFSDLNTRDRIRDSMAQLAQSQRLLGAEICFQPSLVYPLDVVPALRYNLRSLVITNSTNTVSVIT
jgi:hypothetical protein